MKVPQVYRAGRFALVLAALWANTVFASSDPLADVLPDGGAAIGYVLRHERSTYRGAEGGLDQLPLYLYEGERAYLHGTRVGVKLKQDDWRFDVFLRYRFEGFTHDKRPESTAGLDAREPGFDAGFALRRRIE